MNGKNHMYTVHPKALEDHDRHLIHQLHYEVDDVIAFGHMNYVWDVKHNHVTTWDFRSQLIMGSNDSTLCYQVGDTVFLLK